MQKITLVKDAQSGNTLIPKGDYVVSLASDAQVITLSGRGKDYKVAATRRRQNVPNRTLHISFQPGGGRVWSIVVIAPKYGEWIAMIEYQNEKSKD